MQSQDQLERKCPNSKCKAGYPSNRNVCLECGEILPGPAKEATKEIIEKITEEKIKERDPLNRNYD